jgi:hypothetical protein
MAAPVLLISKADFVDWKHVSVNIDSVSDLNTYIAEAQEFDLQPVLGAYLFNEFQTNINADEPEERFTKLLNGETYADSSGNQFQFKGVKVVLIYYVYSRLIINNGLKSTASGMVLKTLENSERISDKQRAQMVNQAKSGARKFEDDLVKYLCDHSTDFPLWANPVRKNKGTVRITAI